MGEIERVAGGSIVGLPHSTASVAGEPVDYVERLVSPEEAWALLPQATRQWAQQAAGAPIRDPVTGVDTVYWYCDVSYVSSGGPSGAARPGEYVLVMFAKRGLVLSLGATDDLVLSPGRTSWRHTRYELPIDATRVRNDHRRQEPANADGSVTSLSPGDPGGDARMKALFPTRVATTFGNLPPTTQRFLTKPFLDAASTPQLVDVKAESGGEGGRLFERFYCYLANKRLVSFCFARRAIPLHGAHLTGTDLWNGSSEARALERAPWDLAAWTAPTHPDDGSTHVLTGSAPHPLNR
jgi:hypothetical protein